MSETLHKQPSPEQRVFGNAFTLSEGVAEESTRRTFFQNRALLVAEGEMTWFPRTLEGEGAVLADLYKDGRIVATLYHDYGWGTTIYVTSKGGDFADTTLCDDILFDDAVTQAEHYATELN